MLKDRKSLEQYLTKESIKLIIHTNACKELYDFINKKYDIPKVIISDIVSARTRYSEISDYILFCLLDGIEQVKHIENSICNEYFTDKEIQTYKNTKYTITDIKFPLKIPMIAVTDNQWIGTISINKLMELRKAQLINYNVNAQRTMQRIIQNEKEVYKIALNWKAIKQIEQSFQDNLFIPNTLTLNIPVETQADFYYDKEHMKLVINKLEHFDITDGYHRYIAACQRKDKDSGFDYQMELRIVSFADDKARQFIFQENQKTKMKKIDAESFNTIKASNIVVTRVNEDARCNLQGLISRNEGLVNLPEMAEIVDYFYFKEVTSKEKEKVAIIYSVKDIIENINALTEYNTKYLEQKYSFQLLLLIFYCFHEYQDKAKEEICSMIDIASQHLVALNSPKFYNKKVRKSLVNEIVNIVKGCV